MYKNEILKEINTYEDLCSIEKIIIKSVNYYNRGVICDSTEFTWDAFYEYLKFAKVGLKEKCGDIIPDDIDDMNNLQIGDNVVITDDSFSNHDFKILERVKINSKPYFSRYGVMYECINNKNEMSYVYAKEMKLPDKYVKK